jgi:hypothetical protein
MVILAVGAFLRLEFVRHFAFWNLSFTFVQDDAVG